MSDAQTTIEQAGTVASRAATDSTFRKQLLAAPAATLQAAGVAIPPGMQVHVLENTSTLVNLVVPARPAGVSDADLKSAAGSPAAAGSSPAEQLAALGALFAQSWADSALQARLLQNPAATLAERGIHTGSGVQVQAVLATDSRAYLVLPPASSGSSATASAVTIGDMAASITQTLPRLAKLVTAGSYIAGLGFSIGATLKFKQHKDNPTQIPVGTPIALIFIAAALVFLPSFVQAAAAAKTAG